MHGALSGACGMHEQAVVGGEEDTVHGRHGRRGAAPGSAAHRGMSIVLEPEPDLHPDLEVGQLVVLHRPSDLGDLEPVDVAQRPGGSADPVADRLVHTVRAAADDLGDAIDVFHAGSEPRRRQVRHLR
jgi:hypothetical protein